MASTAHLDHAVVNSFLRGLHYPLTRDELVNMARRNDQTGDYLAAYQSLPSRNYSGQQQVMDAMQQVGYDVG